MNSGKSTERDEQIVRHIARYRLGLKVVLAHLFFDENESACGNVIQRLLDSKRIQSLDGLPDKYHYYMITKKEAASRGIPENRAEPLGSRALPSWISVLWFCCMGKRQRHLLESKEEEVLFGRSFSIPHCAEEPRGDEIPRVYWIYVPSPNTSPSDIAEAIRGHLKKIREVSSAPGAKYSIADMMREHMYCAAVLVDNEERATKLRELFKDEKSGIRSLTKVSVEKVASPITLQETINDFRKTPIADKDNPRDRLGKKR